ncbi:MAG: hypothetical protein ABSH09_36625 [Bryobacteraceae bacterium]
MSCSRGVPFCIALSLAFSVNAAAQATVFKWVCDPKDKIHRFYRSDLGVVCWDGSTYSKDDAGGIPQYMLDYFKENRQKLQKKMDEMNQHNTGLTAARPANSAAPRRPVTPLGSASGTVVRAAAAPPTVPVSPEMFASIDVGMARSDVLDKLGKPPGSITIPGDDGFVETWTYQLTDGSTAKLHIEKGVVTSRDPKKAEHER